MYSEELLNEIKRLRDEIQDYRHDELTKFKTRKDFNRYLSDFWYDYKILGHRFIIGMVDLDGLHDLNRDISFEAGDEFIKQIANELKEHFEDSNLFRAGGDEFMILRRGNDYPGFSKKLDKITRSSTAAFLVNEENIENFSISDEQDVFNKVDEMVISKKSKNRGRRSEDNYEIEETET